MNKSLSLAFCVTLVVFLQGSQFAEKSSQTKDFNTEQSQSDEDHSNYLLSGTDWVASVSSPQMQPILKWIRDIELPENPVVHTHEILEIGSTQFFQTLFQRIISPNAP